MPTEEGRRLCAFLTAHFPDVVAEDYTARLEAQLDQIAMGNATRLDVLRTFWAGFQPQVSQTTAAVLAPTQPRPLMLRPAED